MLSGFYSASSGIQTAEMRQALIAQNLANINKPGYMSTQASFTRIEDANQRAAAPPGHGTTAADVYRDFTPGAYEHTGRPLDAAINGEGFFVVQGPDGPLYTRDGVFHLNEQNQLTTGGGYVVDGPVQIPPGVPVSQLRIDRQGEVSTPTGQVLGRIRVVEFEDSQRLLPVGDTLFEAPAGMAARDSNAMIEQGTREHSNVNATNELVQMILTQRSHEASQRALRTLADAIEQRIGIQGG